MVRRPPHDHEFMGSNLSPLSFSPVAALSKPSLMKMSSTKNLKFLEGSKCELNLKEPHLSYIGWMSLFTLQRIMLVDISMA